MPSTPIPLSIDNAQQSTVTGKKTTMSEEQQQQGDAFLFMDIEPQDLTEAHSDSDDDSDDDDSHSDSTYSDDEEDDALIESAGETLAERDLELATESAGEMKEIWGIPSEQLLPMVVIRFFLRHVVQKCKRCWKNSLRRQHQTATTTTTTKERMVASRRRPMRLATTTTTTTMPTTS